MIKPLALPKANLHLSKKDDSIFVWCVARKKTLLLTPEEWVRQHVIHYLVNDKNIPLGLIISEHSIKVNKLARRCDIVVFGTDQKPKLIVECKAPEVAINHKVLHQIAQYNFNLNVDYLFLSNGLTHVICRVNRSNNTLDYLEEIPDFSLLNLQ
jgi:hypothetical protein